MRWFFRFFVFICSLLAMAMAGLALMTAFAWPKLPPIDALRDYSPNIPLRIYSADKQLIATYGSERRTFTPINEIPQSVKQALIAAEDERFYQHVGFDIVGIIRATLANLMPGGSQQGASTLTQQVARNFFLSPERSYRRKFYEVLLSVKIERNLNKDQIFEIYLNQIYLGQRSYGFASASQAYFGKKINQLSIAESAMLAGLPKAPSKYNPVANPARATERQKYVLRRMLSLKFIDQAVYDKAIQEKLIIRPSISSGVNPAAAYVADMARQIAYEKFGENIYSDGLKIFTTVTLADQVAAYRAVRRGVQAYDARHGYRGPEAFFDISGIKSANDEALDDFLNDVPDYGDLLAAIVIEKQPNALVVYRRGELIRIDSSGLGLIKQAMANNAPNNQRIRPGALVRIRSNGKNYVAEQLPNVQAALVAIDAQNGDVKALIGGFDHGQNKFNHVTQAIRQPGSSFKPFIYAAALERGFSPSSQLIDQPLTFPAGITGSKIWQPKNYDNRYEGPMSLRRALAKSKNMIAIQLLNRTGTRFTQDYITRFGFDRAKHPPYLTMALGAGQASPWEMVRAYAVFDNGGFLVQPHIIKEIRDIHNRVIARTNAPNQASSAVRVIDQRNAYLMDSMLKDVIQYGTGASAKKLGRADIAGKTGTTNDYVDAWFAGYGANITTISWLGFDQPHNLGKGETGGVAALPMWIDYMGNALKSLPETQRSAPQGLIQIYSPSGEAVDLIYKESLPPVPTEPHPVSEDGGLIFDTETTPDNSQRIGVMPNRPPQQLPNQRQNAPAPVFEATPVPTGI